MKLIIGLGNPGEKYKNSRHNLGFMVVDSFAKDQGFLWRYSQDWICYFIKGEGYVLMKPATYMNRSGVAVAAVSRFFKIDNKDVLTVHDDVDLEFGKVRLTFNSSSAGHYGTDSIIESLGGSNFARLRVGIGRPLAATGGEPFDVEDYVLADFANEQMRGLPEIIQKCEEAISSFIEAGIEATMNRFN